MNREEESATESKKYQHKLEHSLSAYNKRAILGILKESGIDNDVCKAVLQKFGKVPAKAITNYVNSKARMAQEHVGEEANTDFFRAFDKWITEAEKEGITLNCTYELPIVFKAIAELEDHLDPSETGDVDIKTLYTALANLCLGHPLPEMNDESQAFLVHCFEVMIAKIDSSTLKK